MRRRGLTAGTKFGALALLVTAASGCEHRGPVTANGAAVISTADSVRFDFTIVDVALAADLRTLAIADGDHQRVLIADLHSDSRTTVGREGDGPCEFRHLSTIAFADSVTVAVTDAKSGLIALCPLDALTTDIIRIPGTSSRVSRDDEGPLRIALVSGDDSVLALAVSHESHQLDTTAVASIPEIGAIVGTRPRAPVLAPLRDGRLAFGSRAGGYVIGVADQSGARPFAMRDESPARYSPDQVDGMERRTIALLTRTGRPVPDRGFMQTDTLPLKPRFTGRVFASTRGTLWALASADTGSSTLDRFDDATGSWLGRAHIPGGADGMVIRDTVLLAWRRNADGTSVVMSWAIDRTTGAIRTP